MNVLKIDMKKIVPDENQPRKYFDEAKMGVLRDSIKRYGIKNPLALELQKDGSYLIVDGERRFRAASELGLKEVPGLLRDASDETNRLIEQFHLQEMHEGWSSTEKAVAVLKLSTLMDISIGEMAKILGLPRTTVQRYIAFGNIVDKKNFERSNINVEMAEKINQLKKSIKKTMERNDMEFDRNTEKKIENAVFTRIRNGQLTNRSFFVKIGDAITQSPKMIEEFLTNELLTVEKLYSTSKAKGATQLRRSLFSCVYLSRDLSGFEKEKSVKVPKILIGHLKSTKKIIERFINEFEENAIE